jgi:hypothetical protein
LTSFENGKVPVDWKKAEVCAIYKKGPKRLCTNYRPVSLTSIVCKVMESLVRDKILEHMKVHHLFSHRQYGFISGRSTILQLLEVLDQWTLALDNGDPIEAVYMDFQKAFDSVPHHRLIHKLENYGISGLLLNWIKDFLLNRSQRVSVNGKLSQPSAVRSGIPQGSVLGPVLFVIFINDLPDDITSQVFLFADDTKLYRIGEIPTNEEHDELQQDLDRLQNWSDDWLLKFHPEKCKRMLISRRAQDNRIRPLKLKSTDSTGIVTITHIVTSDKEKDLGLIIDNRLKFDSHINAIINKGNKTMGIIRRTFQSLDANIFKPLFTTLVRPILEYGQILWNPHLKGDIRALEGVQRRATKQINGFKNLSYSERLKRLDLPTLRFRRLRGDVIETYKIIHGLYDASVSPQLARPPRPSRGHKHKLFLERTQNLELRRHFFKNRIVKIWNDLPEDVVDAPSLNAFKNRLDKEWKSHPMKFDMDCDLV